MLTEALRRFQAAATGDDRQHELASLLSAARDSCAGDVDLAALTATGRALLNALQPAESSERNTVATGCHDFIDLARRPSVRQVAYDHPDGREWLDTVIELIDRSNFTVGRMFLQRAAEHPDKTLFIVPAGGEVTEYSWQSVADHVDRVARGICALLGDDPRVALFTPNRVEGALIDLACLAGGIFNTMVPANSVAAQLEHILNESQARLLVVSSVACFQTALSAVSNAPLLECVVTLDEMPHVPGLKLLTWRELLQAGDDLDGQVVTDRLTAVRSGDIATTMYTSGTTGMPKGIKFSHLNLVSKRYARASALPDIDETEVLVAYLPLYHTFGRWLEMLACVHLAGTYVFAENPSTETLLQNMQRFKPTALISVPKKWRNLHEAVMTRLGHDAITEGDAEQDAARVREALAEVTGGHLRWGLSAAGRLDPAIFRFFQNHGVELLSGYGMTEATGGITMTPPGRYIEDSIGQALPGIEIKLGPDDELLLRGPYVTPGYTDPAEDDAVFKDGWLHTGDIVSCDAAGFYRHVDRKKDVYKNASGRTIAPQRIESLFADFPEVSRVFAVGDGREYVTLLVRPNYECPDVPLHDMSPARRREYFRALVATCNRFLAPFERVVNFALLDRDFSLEKGELTPKGSFRRSIVEQNFRHAIEPMYASAVVERQVGDLAVKVPVSFLQQLGVTERGVRVDRGSLTFKALDKSLSIRRDPDHARRVWIGNAAYEPVDRVIDLDDWLRLPELWVGNSELVHLSGEGIVLWSLSVEERATRVRLAAIRKPAVPVDAWSERLGDAGASVPSLLSVHGALALLSHGSRTHGLAGIDHLVRCLTAGRIRYAELAERGLELAAGHPDHRVRGRAWVELYEHQAPERIPESVSLFLHGAREFLDDDACRRLAEVGLKPLHFKALSEALASLRRDLRAAGGAPLPEEEMFVAGTLRSLSRIARLAPDQFYLAVRRELVCWLLVPGAGALRSLAADELSTLTYKFRAGLGDGQTEAVDPETHRLYTWVDVARFEDGIEGRDQDRMMKAIAQTPLVREAVYLLCEKRLIDLSELRPGSIWISLLGARFGRAVYHVGLRLANGERCDFAIFVRTTASPETFLTGLRLLAMAAGQPSESPLTPQVGGIWPDHDVATVEYIPGESIDGFARHMGEHPDHHVRHRFRDAALHMCWSALTAALCFHRRTEALWTLGGAVTRDVTVPLEDYDTDTRIRSVAGRRIFAGPLELLLRLKREFLDRFRSLYPAVADRVDEDLLFAATFEAFGVDVGTAFLERAVAESQRATEPPPDAAPLVDRIRDYLRRVAEEGFTPRALHFAIARYRAWAEEVPEATVHARAAQLRELEDNYGIAYVARRFPGTRLRLYAETVLSDIPAPERSTVQQAIHRLRAGGELREVLGQLYHDLQQKLPSPDLHYFLTRAAYPHLDLDEKAELVTSAVVGAARAELVTQHLDRLGRQWWIHPVASAREVDAVHRIFYRGGMGGGLTAQDQLLVTVDGQGTVVAGLSYIRRTPGHVLLDKVAVAPRCRGRGIGQLLMNEFLRRLEAEGVRIISAHLIRQAWLEQFGFHAHPRYPGVVYFVAQPDETPVTAQ